MVMRMSRMSSARRQSFLSSLVDLILRFVSECFPRRETDPSALDSASLSDSLGAALLCRFEKNNPGTKCTSFNELYVDLVARLWKHRLAAPKKNRLDVKKIF